MTQQYPACGFFIDMVVEADGDRLALECDGPTHFDEHGERTVEDLDRLDVLERAGWRILHITYRNWRERPGEQLERIDAWFRDSLQENDTLAENVEEHQASSDGPTTSVSWQGKAIIDALHSGIRDEEAVFKASLPSLGWLKLGSRIRSDLQAAARELTRDGLIVIEDKEYFLTPKGRIAQAHVLERHTRQTPRLASTPQRFASTPSSKTQSGVRYPITCSRCGRPDTVPFKPRTSTGLLCRSCYYRRTR